MMSSLFLVIVAVLAVIFSSAEAASKMARTGVKQFGDENLPPVIKKPLDYAAIVKSLPPSWDYRPLGLMTTDLNQHIPTYWCVIYQCLTYH